jgi:hypothetical protein
MVWRVVVSEYQFYEFLAIDRPLDADEQAAVRGLSTRAEITATHFVNEYHWGDFRGDPNTLMERYYDAHLYFANWGTHRLMIRLPLTLLDPGVVENYCVADQVSAWTTDEHIVLDLTSQEEEADWVETPSLSGIVGVRTELADGDLRPLYLAWLAGYGTWERDEDAFDYADEDELEPPVPPGLATLTGPQRALADFLRLDDDLLAVAARTSPAAAPTDHDDAQLAAWVTNLSLPEKNRVLVSMIVHNRAATTRMELLRRYRDQHTPTLTGPARRTIADLLDTAARYRADRERHEADQHTAEEARRAQARAEARERRLDDLARDEESAWARVESMIDTKKPGEYDNAVTLLTDLQALAKRDDHYDIYLQRSQTLRHTHARKPSLIARLNQAGI